MQGNRRQARQKALTYLYQLDSNIVSQTLDPQKFAQYFDVEERLRDYFLEAIEGVRAHQSVIDQKIQETAENWKLHRMARVDRCILRLAIWELLYRADIPPKVVVDEAIELAKIYGDKNSPAFINGLLDRVANPPSAQTLLRSKAQSNTQSKTPSEKAPLASDYDPKTQISAT